MRRMRLAILGESPCGGCAANCCKRHGPEYAVLLEGDDERRRFAAFSVAVPIEHAGRVRVERVLPYVGGRCQFLGGDDRCTIYEDRPVNCRRFQCVTGFHGGGSGVGRHSAFLEANPTVLRMLEEL